jgi:serine/threonine protein kinase
MRDNRFVSNREYYVRLGSLFYEPLEQWYTPRAHFREIVEDRFTAYQAWGSWRLQKSGLWFYAEPKAARLPPQGWKIHVSAQPRRAGHVLATVADILIPRGVPFKFVLDETLYTLMLDKRWPRGSSGKFITIYPSTLDHFRKLLAILYEVLKDEEGPYILSDKRYRDCKVLYYRYGGFLPMNTLMITGERPLIIRSPTGAPVLDKRLPYFSLPEWVSDPFGESDTEAETDTSPDGQLELNKRYRVEQALYFSNAGGVYLARDTKTGEKVVLKEARPYTSVDSFGNDAVSLRKREWEILHLLEDTDLVPRPLDFFYEGEHCFLVETYVEGRDIREILLKDNPLTKIKPSAEDSERYYDMYRRLFLSFVDGLEVIHSKGIVCGDLSANNLIVTDDYRVRFVDMEAAYRVDVDKPTNLYTLGFRNPDSMIRGKQSFKDDLYTLGVVMTYMLFPVNAMANLRDDVYQCLVRRIIKDLGWPSKIALLIHDLVKGKASYNDVRDVLQWKEKLRSPQLVCNVTEDELERIVESMGNFILRSMKDNNDYLFPSDPFMFLTNPLSLGFGAMGVLYSLQKCNRGIPRKAWQYLDMKLKTIGTSNYPPGLLTGIAGCAWVAWELGREEEAEKLMRLTKSHPLLKTHHSLFYGMAGIGLSSLYFWLKTGKDEFLDLAVNLANELVAQARQDEKGLFWDSDGEIYLGLGYGQTGVALFLLRLSQATKDQKWQDVGRQALNYDLCCGKEIEKGITSFPDKPDSATLEPYLEEGTAGIVKVLLRYGMIREAESLSTDLMRKYSISASYLFGLGSLVDALVDLYLWTGDDTYLQMAQRPLAGIRDLYLIKTKHGLATPGDGGLAISCDWGTGVAGVMRVLHRYLTRDKADFMLDELNTLRR